MWENARQLAAEGRFDEIPAELYIKHLQAFQQIRNIAISKTTPLERFTLRPWQQDLLNILEGPVNNRRIYWYWDELGGNGKSWMGTFLARNHGAITISSGKTADIAYLYNPTRIVVFDISRATTEQNMDHINYGVMEDIKNGRLMSSKYMSTVKYFDPPHMVVFSNKPCPHGKFSADRIVEVDLDALNHRRRPVDQPEPVPAPMVASYATNFRRDADENGIPPPAQRRRLDDEAQSLLGDDLLDILNV